MDLPMYALRKDICMMMANSAAVRQQHTVSEMRADMVRHDRGQSRGITDEQKPVRCCRTMFDLTVDSAHYNPSELFIKN